MALFAAKRCRPRRLVPRIRVFPTPAPKEMKLEVAAGELGSQGSPSSDRIGSYQCFGADDGNTRLHYFGPCNVETGGGGSESVVAVSVKL